MCKTLLHEPLFHILCLSGLLFLTGTIVHAHDARPLYLKIEQESTDLFHAMLAVPSSVEADNLHPIPTRRTGPMNSSVAPAAWTAGPSASVIPFTTLHCRR